MSDFFENKIKDYRCNFALLDELVSSQTEASDYYAWVRDTYKQYYAEADEEQKSKFIIRYYRAKKLMYSAAQMFVEARYAKNNACVVAYYYLMYYALFQAMQANLIVCTAYDDNKVLMLSHEHVKNYFAEQFCKPRKCPLDEGIIIQLENLRKYREYYSYAMPFNLSKNALIEESVVERYIKICCQLLNFRLFVFAQEVCRSIPLFDPCMDSVKAYMHESCSRMDSADTFQDDADENFWNELVRYGGADIMPISLTFEHDFDEYGTYDRDVYEKMNMPRTRRIAAEALSLVYSVL